MNNLLFSKFTNDNLKLIKKIKENIDDDNVLLKYIRNEKNNIKQFICQKSFDIKFKKIVDDKILDNFNKFSDCKWVLTKKIQEIINNTNELYHISWGSNNIYVITDTIDDLKQRFIILVYIIEYLKYKSKSDKVFNIYLILSSFIKYFPTKKEIIDVKHVNTGYTDFLKNIIFIWRREEFEKVLFHEIIHYTEFFDHDIHIHHDLNIKGPTSYYEAVTDLWAIIYNCIYISFMKKMSVKIIFEIELAFVKNQATSLYYFFNNEIIQKSPAYSYYIIKYMLFNYLIDNNIDPTKINDDIITNAVKQNIFFNSKYIKLDSLRMTLFELK